MLLPIRFANTFRIIAHRGASGYAPENTRAAFDLALKMGIREIELDTQLSSDGQVVLCHDRTLERYGHGPRVVEELSWVDLQDLDMGSWFSPFLYRGERMLSLEALFETYGTSFIYHVELKGQAGWLPEKVACTIDRHSLEPYCIITSFALESLLVMKRIRPALRLGWLVHQVDTETLARAHDLELFQLCPHAPQVDKTLVIRAGSVVPEVRAWGVNGAPAEVLGLIRQVRDAGCHGMTINWPDWVCHVPADGL